MCDVHRATQAERDDFDGPMLSFYHERLGGIDVPEGHVDSMIHSAEDLLISDGFAEKAESIMCAHYGVGGHLGEWEMLDVKPGDVVSCPAGTRIRVKLKDPA